MSADLIVFPRGKDPVVFEKWPRDFQPQGKGYYCHLGSWYKFHTHKALNRSLTPEQVPKTIRAWALVLS
jgi:hypothetical protein